MRALLFASLLAARLRAAACFGYESIYARIIEEQVLVKFTEHVTMAGTMMTAFSTGWLYNGTVVLDDVRALVYTQALAASDDVYFVWTGHPSGAFVGYYNKGFLAAANGSRALGWVAASSDVFSGDARREARRHPIALGRWVGDENFTCPAYGVDGICRAYYAIDAARGTPLDQFDGIGYDPRLRAWYYEMADAYDGYTSASAWSGIYRDATLSATQHFPEDLNTSVPSNDHAMGLCSSLLGLDGAFLGVGCTAILLGSLDDAFRLAFADVDPASVLAYIREASSGYVVVASVPNATQLHAPSTTLNSASEVLFYEALSHPNDLIRTSAAHLEATGSWNRTGGPFDHAGLYYDVAAITDNGLDWNLVTLQRQSCPEGYYTSLAPGDYGSCQACQAPTTTADNNNDTYCPLCAVGYYRDGGGCRGGKRERHSQLQRLRSRSFSTRFG